MEDFAIDEDVVVANCRPKKWIGRRGFITSFRQGRKYLYAEVTLTDDPDELPTATFDVRCLERR